MKRLQAVLALFGVIAMSSASAQTNDEMIADAVLPLPQSMRAEAGVFMYDDKGMRQTLRQGSNAVECKVRNEKGQALCYSKATAERRDFSAKLTAQGMEGDELRAAVAAAEAAGTIAPTPTGSMLYRHDENEKGLQLLWVVMLPNMTASDLGISTTSQFKNAVAGQGRPWMMAEGTPSAHLMIPVNSTDLSNKGGATSPLDPTKVDPLTRATLALPEDLRSEATVVKYNVESGARETLRKGSNGLACVQPTGDMEYTRCSHESNLPELDMRMKLAAEGKSAEETNEIVAAAIESGELTARTFGGLAYRYYEGDDRMKMLWVLRVPGLMAADTGMPTMAERDNLSVGKGTPWLMREGTPSAHLMIPINGTELSNFY